MSDLTDRLIEWANDAALGRSDMSGCDLDLKQAAAEITRLRAENDALVAQVRRVLDRAEKAEAEVERLRTKVEFMHNAIERMRRHLSRASGPILGSEEPKA